METFLLNLLKTSLLGSLAILAMLILKPLWRERYRAKTRCWLWLALAVFLLLPVDFSVKNAPVQAEPPKDYTLFVGTDKTAIQSTDNLFGDMAEKSGQSPAQVRDTIIQRPVTNPEQKTTRYIPVTTILFYGYLAGAAAFLLYQGVSYALFRRTVRRWKRNVARADYAAMLSDTARDLGVSAPEMIVCEAISTPAVTGLLRPRLLLPHERYDVQELRYILRHELCHLKRRDMLLKLVLLAANAMHWFNPVVYLMLRQADEDIELACDSAATDGLELPERAAYSRTLLAAVQSSVRALPATTCFGGTVERLKRRITNVLGAQKKRGLGVVALVLALTLTAGCAVSWGERAQAQKNDDPFADKHYTVDTLLYEAPAFTDGFTADGTYPTFLTATNAAGEKYVTLCDPWGYALIYGPMEEYKLEKQSFYALFGNTRDASPVDDLMQHNKSAWTGYCEEAKDSQPYQAYLLEQEDGTIYLGLSADYAEDGSECFCMVYRLNEQDDTIYASMDDYAAACVKTLKNDTMTYYSSENSDYGSKAIQDTVADVRVTRLELGDSLGNLSPEHTVLELWYFNYEMRPTNEAGVQIDVVGGQALTDDGYLNENWTHYLTVLHYTSGEKTGYQIIGTYAGNDGLWYNGCNYSGEEKYYLHDFYIDYAGLGLPKMLIPNLLDSTSIADGYGNAVTVPARLVSGNGSYWYYVPVSGWNWDEGENWYSQYPTDSTFSIRHREESPDEAAAEWTAGGYTGEQTIYGWRFATHEGLSNTVIRICKAPDDTCYELELHWLYDGSAENKWGWLHDRQTAMESEELEAMADSFHVNWDTADPAAEITAAEALGDALTLLSDTNLSAVLTLDTGNAGFGGSYDSYKRPNRAHFVYALKDLSWEERPADEFPTDETGIERLSTVCGRWSLETASSGGGNFLLLTDTQSSPSGKQYLLEASTYAEGRVWGIFRLLYDDAELNALTAQLAPIPDSGQTWQEAAQQWAAASEAVHLRVTSGSSSRFTYVKTSIEPDGQRTLSEREAGDFGPYTEAFVMTTIFVPETDYARGMNMAGSTVDYRGSDPDVPAGALERTTACAITKTDDGWVGQTIGW